MLSSRLLQLVIHGKKIIIVIFSKRKEKKKEKKSNLKPRIYCKKIL